MRCLRCETKTSIDKNFCTSCGLIFTKNIKQQMSRSDLDLDICGVDTPTKKSLADGDYALPLDKTGRDILSKIPLLPQAAHAVIKHWSLPLERAKLLGDGLKVSSTQIPKIHDIAKFCSQKLDMGIPDIFIKYDPRFNAQALGTQEDNLILLHSSLVDAFNDRELAFIIGHEMGHIKNHHVLYNTVLYFISGGADFLSGIGAPIYMPLLAWSRSAELTADRAGLLATKDLEGAIRALVKLVVGSETLLRQVNLKELISQAEQKNFYSTMGKIFNTHPYMVDRIKALVDYIKGGNYDILKDESVNNYIENKDDVKKEESNPSRVESKGSRFCKKCDHKIGYGVDRCPYCGEK